MALPISRVQEVMEVTIYEAIRLELVAQGYLPDLRDETLYPDTQAGNNAYEAAKVAIKTSKGFCIDLFNNSNPRVKGLKDLPRIVLIFDDPIPGDIGNDPSVEYIFDSSGPDISYSPRQGPVELSDIPFSVHLVTEDSTQRRTLIGILANAIPTKGYLPIFERYEFRAVNVFVELMSSVTLPSSKDDLMERVYRYVLKDLFLVDFLKEFDPVSALKEITVTDTLNSRATLIALGQ